MNNIVLSVIASSVITFICGAIIIYHQSVAYYVMLARKIYHRKKKELGGEIKFAFFLSEFKKTVTYMQMPAQFDIIFKHPQITEQYFNMKRCWRPHKYYTQLLKEIESNNLKLSTKLNKEHSFVIYNILDFAQKENIETFSTKQSAAIIIMMREHKSLNNSYSIRDILKSMIDEFPNFKFCCARAHEKQIQAWTFTDKTGVKRITLDTTDKAMYEKIESIIYPTTSSTNSQ